MEKFFKLKENGTNVKTEVMAGIITFFTVVYIIFVNPKILSSVDGIPVQAMFISTIVSSIIGTLLMALGANLPYALAPGMGINALFAFTVCGAMGFRWQEALAITFLSGLLMVIINITKLRKYLIVAIPQSLRYAISGGIGLFIAYSGLKNGGFLQFTSDHGSYNITDAGSVISNGSIVPALAHLNNPNLILSILGLFITIALISIGIKSAIFIGIIITTIIGVIMGVINFSNVKLFDFSNVSSIKEVFFAMFGEYGFRTLFTSPEKTLLVVIAVFALTIADLFDSLGSFIGTGRIVGFLKDDSNEDSFVKSKGLSTKMEKAMFFDSLATVTGSLTGSSNVTVFVESTSGISAGGRTGLTGIVICILFFLCIPFSGVIGAIPTEVTAPSLIIVGIMIASSLTNINWSDFCEAAPAFIMILFMTAVYSISDGIAAGLITYCVVKISKKEFKQIHPITLGITLLFILKFIVFAIKL